MAVNCEECGMEVVNHRLEKFSLRMDHFFKSLFRPLEFIVLGLGPLVDRFLDAVAPVFFSLFFRTGLARKLNSPDERSSETAQALWAEAAHRNIEMYEARLFGLPRRTFIARRGDKTIVFDGLPRPPRAHRSTFWMDDKAEMKIRFQQAGFPVPTGGQAANENQALEIFNKLGKPVIVKPHEGSAGRHTTVNVRTADDLRFAYRSAVLVSPYVVVEEEMLGPVFRATLVGRKTVAVLRRDPPHVVGDGHSTVRELAERENNNPLRRGPVFAKIDLDSAVSVRELQRQSLALESVPSNGQIVLFHFKVNWGVGGTSYDVTSQVHPENFKLFDEIGEYLGQDIVGVDFMIQDISRSWREQERCGVIECNSLPLIGNHHFPYKGPVRNVAGAVWEMAFPNVG